jgi:hypothetical protein
MASSIKADAHFRLKLEVKIVNMTYSLQFKGDDGHTIASNKTTESNANTDKPYDVATLC